MNTTKTPHHQSNLVISDGPQNPKDERCTGPQRIGKTRPEVQDKQSATRSFAVALITQHTSACGFRPLRPRSQIPIRIEEPLTVRPCPPTSRSDAAMWASRWNAWDHRLSRQDVGPGTYFSDRYLFFTCTRLGPFYTFLQNPSGNNRVWSNPRAGHQAPYNNTKI